MAETYTQEGLDYIYNAALRGTGTRAGSSLWYVALFVSQTPTTVAASTASGSPITGWTEMSASTGTYSRQSTGAASAITASGDIGGSARGSAWPQVTFTGFTSASPANGFAIVSTSSGSCTVIALANFDSGASRALVSTSDQLLVTPTLKATP